MIGGAIQGTEGGEGLWIGVMKSWGCQNLGGQACLKTWQAVHTGDASSRQQGRPFPSWGLGLGWQLRGGGGEAGCSTRTDTPPHPPPPHNSPLSPQPPPLPPTNLQVRQEVLGCGQGGAWHLERHKHGALRSLLVHLDLGGGRGGARWDASRGGEDEGGREGGGRGERGEGRWSAGREWEHSQCTCQTCIPDNM